MQETMSAATARRMALSAQLFGRVPPGRFDRGTLRRALERMSVLQIDSVNVLARAHRVPLFSRFGGYPVDVLEQAVWTAPRRAESRLLVEAWAHEASMIPVDLHPAVRVERRHWSRRLLSHVQRAEPGLLDRVVQVITERGASGLGDIDAELGTDKGRPGWWEWSMTKQAAEGLFAEGVLGVAQRRGFERVYDLIERIVPARVLAQPVLEPAEAHRILAERAARAHGIGTVKDLADYFRLPVAAIRTALAELAEQGTVVPVQVAGWAAPAYRHAETTAPRRVGGAALLCPFDPLIWERDRTERIFGMRYRIEIYTPAAKRQFGYYVFPLLVGDRLVGRFDLKADRATRRLLVRASWHENISAARPDEADAAADRLWAMADWLDLDEVVIEQHGTWWRPVAEAVHRNA